MSDDSPLEPLPQIRQEIRGDGNQGIGRMENGTAFNNHHGNVVIHNYYYREEVKNNSAESAKVDQRPCPYRGLYHFSPGDTEYFFGRKKFIEELVQKTQTRNFIAVLGASGSGKSSVVFAGLVPKLQEAGHWQFTYFRPGADPFYALAEALVPLYRSEGDSTDKMTQASKLAKSLEDGEMTLSRIFISIQHQHPKDRVLLIADQFEELYTLCTDETIRHKFLDTLLAGIPAPVDQMPFPPLLVATIRADFLGNALSYRPFADALQNADLKLGPMNRKELTEAISNPAANADRPLDFTTVDRLIEQTEDHEGTLPLLQFALTRIWAGLAERKEPAQTLKAIGGVGGALAGKAQEIYSNLNDEEKEIARRVFLEMVQLGEGVKATRRRIQLEQVVSRRNTLEQVQRVINRFAHHEVRFITLAGDEGTKTAEVTHEALFDNWGQMKEWLDTSRSDLRFQRRLDEAARVWEEHGRPEGNLWRSPDLDLLRKFSERLGDEMTTLQVEFFEASVDAADAQQQVEQEQIQLEKDFEAAKLKAAQDREESQKTLVKEAEKRIQVQRGLTAAVGIGLVLMTGAAIFVSCQEQQSQHQQVELLAQRVELLAQRVELLAAYAEALVDSRPVDAEINAIVAIGLSRSDFGQFPNRLPPKTVNAVNHSLLKAIQENREHNKFLDKNTVRAVAYSKKGKRIVTGGEDKTLQVWDAETGQPIVKLSEKGMGTVNSVAYSPDDEGKYIVSGSKDKTVRVWDVTTGKIIQKFEEHDRSVNSVAYSPDGKYIVSGSNDKKVLVWNVTTGKVIQKFEGHEGSVTSVAYSPKDQYIVSGSEDKTVRVWDMTTGQARGEPFKHGNTVWSVAYSPDGKNIVSGSSDKTVQVWNAETKKIIKTFKGHQDVVNAVVYKDDNHIISGSGDKTVRVWNVNNEEDVKIFIGHEDQVLAISVSKDGKHIISGSRDKTVRVWDAAFDQNLDKPLAIHFDGKVYSVAYSPDGKHIVVGSNKTVSIWDAKTGESIGVPFKEHEKNVEFVGYSPDKNGKYIVSGSDDGKVLAWEASTRKPIGKIKYHDGGVYSVVYSPNSKYIVSGSEDNTVRIWNATTGDAIGKPFTGHNNYVWSAAYSPDENGKYIVSGSNDGTVQVWDAKTRKLIGKPFTGHNDRVLSVAFSPDGKYIASGSHNKTVRISDATTGDAIGKPFTGHADQVNSVAYGKDGNNINIVSGSKDHTARVWNAKTGVGIGEIFTGHKDAVWSVAYSPDGKHIASGSLDGTLQVWNIDWASQNLAIACKQLQYHRSLRNPTNPIEREARETCERYVWKKQSTTPIHKIP